MGFKHNVFTMWIEWQFIEVPRFLLRIWKNYILFALNYSSLSVLLKSLFSPWRNYRWNYPSGFNPGEFLGTMISNFFSRILGAIARSIFIVFGIFFQIFVILSGLTVFLFWILMPFIIIAGIIFVFTY